MIKKSPSRNQRSKGVKVKHVLQILLLLCICFWLLYQIKCSYDRSREMSVKVSKTPVMEDDGSGGLKLGRKDLHEKQHEEEDEESKDQDEGNQGEREDAELDEDDMRREIEGNKESEHQEGKKDDGDVEGSDNPEEDEGREEEEGNDKMDEVDDERGGDDTEINEAEVEGRADIDREEDFLDEDKGGQEERVDDEGEEDNYGDKEEQIGDDDIPEDKDPDEISENAHEAREVNYQADDASVVVARDSHADNENADENSKDTETVNRLPNSKAVSLNEKESEATTGDKTEANSSVSEGDKRASNVLLLADTELTGSRTNVTESVIDLPQARRLSAPDKGIDDVSLEEMTGAKIENASTTTEKTQNGLTMTNHGSYQTGSTADTSTQEPMKPSDPSNNQMVHISDDVPNVDKNQELDASLKTPPSREDKENAIQMQVPDEDDRGEGRKQ